MPRYLGTGEVRLKNGLLALLRGRYGLVLTTAVESSKPIVSKRFKTIGLALNELTFTIKPFNTSIGDTCFKEAKNVISPLH